MLYWTLLKVYNRRAISPRLCGEAKTQPRIRNRRAQKHAVIPIDSSQELPLAFVWHRVAVILSLPNFFAS